MKKDLYNPAVVSYSFRSKQNGHQYRDGNFIFNFPIHIWLYALGMPKVLSNLILFEYWLPEEENIEALPVFPLDQISNPFLINYPLRDEKGELFFKSAPEGSDERSMATLALEARLYKSGSYNIKGNLIVPGKYALLERELPPVLKLIGFPKVLNKFVLGYLNYEHWHYLWRDNIQAKNYQCQFPWKDDEKHQRFTRLMVEADQYPVQEHNTIILKGLLFTLVKKLPEVLITIITDYIGNEITNESNKTNKDFVLDELEHFIKKYLAMEAQATHTVINYYVLKGAHTAIKAIREGKGFQPLPQELLKSFEPKCYTKQKAFPGYPVKHYFEFLHKFFSDLSFSRNHLKYYDMTFFEHIIRHIDHLEPAEIQNVSRVFRMAKSLIESAYILSTKAPSSTTFYFGSEMIGSLCRHIVQDLQRGGEIKDLSNRGQRPVLLNKISEIVQKPLTSIEFNDMKGFLGTFATKDRGIQFLNYHKRSNILNILYKYINDTKSRSVVSVFFSSEENYSKQATDLADRLSNIPFGSPKEFVIVDEIQKLLASNTLKSAPYRKALMQGNSAG